MTSRVPARVILTMKFCVIGIPELNAGIHNVKDPRLDQADKLVEAKKKVYVQVELAGEETLLEAEAIIAHPDRRPDLVLHDLEFVETRLGREPSEIEKTALKKVQAALEKEQFIHQVELTAEERQALVAYGFVTQKPVTVATVEELANLGELLVRAFRESGYISFLTVGGKENRAWMIKQGVTAVEAAGAIHTDLMKGFIRAEIIGFDDFIQAGGETQAKRAGKQRLETKEYVMQDCDVTNFRFSK